VPITSFITGLADQTVRNIVHTTIGGSRVRVRLSNGAGTQPVTFNAAYIGLQLNGGNIVPGSNQRLTFGGKTSVTIPAGADALSDEVRFSVEANQNLAVSFYTATATGVPSMHNEADQTTYIANGNVAGVDSPSFQFTSHSWYFMREVEVRTSRDVEGAIVPFGDSITDGTASTIDANHRYPDFLARRIQASRGPRWAVLNEGYGGDRVLTDSGCFGVNGVARLDRDVLLRPGAKAVILLMGINDIGFSDAPAFPPPLDIYNPCFEPKTNVSAEQIIDGYRQIIAQVHAKGMRVYGGTLTPYKGAFYWTPSGEAKRETINTWIRESGAFDGVVDFAAALADPADPLRMRLQFDSGDHLHPNDAGYEAMANAVDLRMIERGAGDSDDR
jgi:lysophospholipase L1-like esterase